MSQQTKHIVEDQDSWDLHRQRQEDRDAFSAAEQELRSDAHHLRKRSLKHHHHHHSASDDPVALEAEKERDFWARYKEQQRESKAQQEAQVEERNARMDELFANPGIGMETVHGIMIDAGSTGSRLHVYEWAPRSLHNKQEIASAVSGDMLSFPGTESRWTDRLRPGLDSFATVDDEAELDQAIEKYLSPLFEFAKSVLHTKQASFSKFPVFLRATAGMRILDAENRARVMASVRRVLKNQSFNPFAFQNEQARVLSGEEEAIYDWTGVNFLMGDLLKQSTGAGTVVNPKKTHGALDLGGGSTQISFYEPNEDIMSNLFKLQIGQAKHWNVYAHSFLFFGMNEAIHRHEAHLAAGKTTKERVVDGIYNPCLPKGARVDVRSDIHLATGGVETWDYNETYPSGTGDYQATLFNDGHDADNSVEHCLSLAEDLLHLENNAWCNFSHKGDCSLAGVYQPKLPTSKSEFVAFSNYHHVWKFLHLPEKATIQQLYDATQHACSLDKDELKKFAKGRVDDSDLDSYCFRSAYVFQLLHNGYGFQMDDSIRVVRVLKGQKVGWALGAMLYEINTLPWEYQEENQNSYLPGYNYKQHSTQSVFVGLVAAVMAMAIMTVFFLTWRRRVLYQSQYEPVKDQRSGSEDERNLLLPRH